MNRRSKVLSAVLIVVIAVVAALAVTLSHNAACTAAPELPAGATLMKAIAYRCYGSPDVARLESLPKPTAEEGRILVKVRAASVNPLDWHYLRGEPYIMRMSVGTGAPKDMRLGVDFAGVVEAVGNGVTRYKPGDEIYGGADGSFAEYVTVREGGSVALKPANMTFEQAAAVPIAAITALQALRDQGSVRAGQQVLINGASGGVGTFAVQLAKQLGAEVTAVCSGRNAALVRSLGADQVIDYNRQAVTLGPQRYDLIIDTVGTHSINEFRRVLTPQGTLVIVGAASAGRWIGGLSGALQAMIVSPFVKQKVGFFLAKLNHDDLDYLGKLMAEGKLVPVIDRRYPLAETAEALRYVEAGHSRGKVVIAID